MKWEQAYASLADQSLSLPRFGHSAVASTDGNGSAQVVIYGGVGCHAGETAQTALGDVAVLQVDSGTWSAADIQPGPSPGPRAFHSAAALAGGRAMLLFGGHILTYDSEHNRKRRNFFSDVWQLDLVKWQWRQLPCDSSSSSPARRDMSALLQLQDGRLVLFGGRSEQGKALQDTWTYDVDSNTWQQLKPVGALPPARKMHSMAQVGQQVVLFGGESDSGPLDDVWLLGGWGPGETLRWTQLRLRASPQPRFGHAMAVCSGTAAPSGSEHGDSSSSSDSGSSIVSSDAEQVGSDQPPSPFVTAAAAGGGGSTSTVGSTPAGGPAGAPAAAAAATAEEAVDGSSSGGDKGRQQQQQQRVVVFGGCLDLSGFLSLNKNYVQSKDTWVLQLDSLTWLQLQQPSGGAAAAATGAAATAAAAAVAEPEGSPQPVPWPCERMCHSMTPLPDGRLLVFGGRNKEGICSDMWLLDTSGELSLPAEGSAGVTQPGVLPALPPASPRPSTAGSTGSGSAAAAAKPSPSRPGSQSLLQSLLGPVRGRVPSQGLLVRRDSASAQQGAGPASTPPTSTPSSSLPASPKRSQQQQQLEAGGGSQPGLEGLPAAAGDSAAGTTDTSASAAHDQQQQQGGGAFAAVPAAAAAASSGSSQQQALATLMDVSSGEFAKLLRNPAAYSAGAIGKLSSSVTSTVSSLLVGKDGQPGTMLPRLPEALMRVAPHWAPTGPFSSRSGNTSSSSQAQQQNQGVDMPALAPLRQQMGLLQGAAAAAGGGHGSHELKAPAHIQQELAGLGHQLLTDGGGGGGLLGGPVPAAPGSLPTEVLIAAARQYLMATEALQLRLRHVALLLADYQELAASYSAHMMLSRLSEGFSAAAAANGASKAVADGAGQSGPTFLQRRPTDLLVHQVEQLQQQYQHLLLRNAA